MHGCKAGWRRKNDLNCARRGLTKRRKAARRQRKVSFEEKVGRVPDGISAGDLFARNLLTKNRGISPFCLFTQFVHM